MITEQPASSAPPILREGAAIGVKAPTGPIGSRRINCCIGYGPNDAALKYAAPPLHPIREKLCATSLRASAIGLPCSSVMIRAIDSARSHNQAQALAATALVAAPVYHTKRGSHAPAESAGER